jgi:hypothetical protein
LNKITLIIVLVATLLSGCISEEKVPDQSIDSDSDGLTDAQEGILKTNPFRSDSDNDGLIDSLDPNPLVPSESETGDETSEVDRIIKDEILGSSDERPDQAYILNNVPPTSNGLIIEVYEGGVWMEWKRVENFMESTSEDRHYTLNRETGEIRFGDG